MDRARTQDGKKSRKGSNLVAARAALAKKRAELAEAAESAKVDSATPRRRLKRKLRRSSSGGDDTSKIWGSGVFQAATAAPQVNVLREPLPETAEEKDAKNDNVAGLQQAPQDAKNDEAAGLQQDAKNDEAAGLQHEAEIDDAVDVAGLQETPQGPRGQKRNASGEADEAEEEEDSEEEEEEEEEPEEDSSEESEEEAEEEEEEEEAPQERKGQKRKASGEAAATEAAPPPAVATASLRSVKPKVPAPQERRGQKRQASREADETEEADPPAVATAGAAELDKNIIDRVLKMSADRSCVMHDTAPTDKKQLATWTRIRKLQKFCADNKEKETCQAIMAFKASFSASETSACWQDLAKTRGGSEFSIADAWITMKEIGKKPVVNEAKHSVLFEYFWTPGDSWKEVMLKETMRHTLRKKKRTKREVLYEGQLIKQHGFDEFTSHKEKGKLIETEDISH